MGGLGESFDEVVETMRDLRANDVDVVTIGQYLQPTKKHRKMKRYVTPEEFDRWTEIAKEMGFLYVASGPMVRSSYKAGELFLENVLKERREKAAVTNPHV